jgi:tRNA(adenine34) deaminase
MVAMQSQESMHKKHQDMMNKALDLARKAETQDEVPIGAVICDEQGAVIGEGWNLTRHLNDPTAHAEIQALRKAARKLDNYRLPGTTLYVTLEPCIMCMGAILHSRVQRLVFGAFDPKAGAAGSKYQVGEDGLLNHRLEIQGGLMTNRCSAMLQEFFRRKRRG